MTPLHHFGEWLRQLLIAVPMPAARALFVGALVLVLWWVVRLPRSETTPPGGAKRWDQDLKVGAIAALILQIVIYSLF